jgi:hypothetical protein
MNTSTNKDQTPPKIPGHLLFEPMPEAASPALVLESLLKYPGRIIYELQYNWRVALPVCLSLLVLVGTSAYGLVVGSFSGGAQIWIAPAKIVIGTSLSILICLPSLYIFISLGGVEARLRTVIGVFLAALGLGTLILIGFAPVAWIFSQSTDSVAFIAGLHIGLWIIGVFFGLRLIRAMSSFLGGPVRPHLKTWNVIFVLVCLQMMTTLRPIVGKSEHFLPGEKKFFLAHWLETVTEASQKKK